jgi:hypothetical protein
MASPDEMAEQVYNRYPRKVGRTAAIKAIHKAAKQRMKAGDTERDAYAFLYRAVTAYAKSGEATSREKKFIPYPATWFNAGRYDDDPSEWEVSKPEPRKVAVGLWSLPAIPGDE